MTNGYTGTYSPADNKLRLYSHSRLDSEIYNKVKAAGFKWAPKQGLFVAPMWSPDREDILLELCEEIQDEDITPEERAAERADRFEKYSDKREEEAERAHKRVDAITEHIPTGQPILVGHHSEKHARKHAKQIENGIRQAVNLWDTSKHWKQRAKSALRHAERKERPDVRARRIKKIEANKRKHEKYLNESRQAVNFWLTPVILSKARALAITEIYCHVYFKFSLTEYHREAPASQYEGEKDLWSALRDGTITPRKARNLHVPLLIENIEREKRWINHFNNRLEYEKAMLEESGGTIADKTGPEKGGACKCWASHRGGFSYITKVNKVTVTILDNWGNGGSNFTRTIAFDKLKMIMTAKEVQDAKESGRLVEFVDKTGFALIDEPIKRTTYQEPEKTKFDDLKETLKEGIQIVSAPQLFNTPEEWAKKIVELADIEENHKVLEPEAGTGRLLKAIGNKPDKVAIEINYDLVKILARCGVSNLHIIHGDFLEQKSDDLGKFDRIIMNPPFKNGIDIEHINHALTFLKLGGKLVSLCSGGPRQKAEFKNKADYWEDLPAGSFKEEGTGVNVSLIVVSNYL